VNGLKYRYFFDFQKGGRADVSADPAGQCITLEIKPHLAAPGNGSDRSRIIEEATLPLTDRLPCIVGSCGGPDDTGSREICSF
jgi:hypothetical protein